MKSIKHFDFYELDEIAQVVSDNPGLRLNKNLLVIDSSWQYFNPSRYGMRIEGSASVEFIFFRSLLGGVGVKYNSPFIRDEDKIFFVDKNLFNIPCSEVVGSTIFHEINSVFHPLSFNKTIFMNYFKDQRSNSGFYINMLFELINSNYSTQKNQHTKAFLHIYRAYEHLAYSFPLIFVSTSKSYEGSYSKLKKYFKDGGDSELAFGKSFISDNVDKLMLDSIITINDSSGYVEKVLLKLSINNFITFDNGVISFPLQLVWDMVIEVRNKYFHHLAGMGSSFNSQLLVDSDEFFKYINKPALTLLAAIYFSILTKRL